MVVLGLVLVLVAVVAGVVLVYENSGSDHTVTISAFGGEWRADAYWLAVVGAAILLVAVLGLALMRGGSRRAVRRRQERKQLERENADLAERVRRERAEAERLDANRGPGGSTAPVHDAEPDRSAGHGGHDPFVKRDDDTTYDRPPTR